MTPVRSPAQKAAWERRSQLGQLTSLSRWLVSKTPVVRACPLSEATRDKLIRNMQALSADLWSAAKEMGWKGPT